MRLYAYKKVHMYPRTYTSTHSLLRGKSHDRSLGCTNVGMLAAACRCAYPAGSSDLAAGASVPGFCRKLASETIHALSGRYLYSSSTAKGAPAHTDAQAARPSYATCSGSPAELRCLRMRERRSSAPLPQNSCAHLHTLSQ